MLMIEGLVTSGTDADRKTRLLAALVEALDGAGTDPNDIMVFFGEIRSRQSILRRRSACATSRKRLIMRRSWSQRYARWLYGPEREVVRCPPNFAPVP